jgi:hypothetical protein
MSLVSALPYPKRCRTGFEKVGVTGRGELIACVPAYVGANPASGHYEVEHEHPRRYDVARWATVFSIFAI